LVCLCVSTTSRSEDSSIVVKIRQSFYQFGLLDNKVKVTSDCLNWSCPLVVEALKIKQKNQFFVEGKNPNALYCTQGLKGDIYVGEISKFDQSPEVIQLCGLMGSFIELSDVFYLRNK